MMGYKRAGELTLVGHLEELRIRILKSAIAVMIAFCFSCLWIDAIFSFLTKPIGTLVFISPTEAFIANIAVAFFSALCLSSPFVIYQVWQFVSAGLTAVEKIYARIFTLLSIVLFALGVMFAYFVMVPVALTFLLRFSSGHVIPMITVSRYIAFVGVFILSFGIVFELPLAIIFLTMIGIITPQFLAEKRRYAVVLIFIISAILTPPDCVTQILMAVPLMVLYEAGLLCSRLTYRLRHKQADGATACSGAR